MEKLLNFLNSLSQEDRFAFCKKANTSENYIRKAVCTKSNLGIKLCSKIEQATNGQVTRRDLRPDDWHEIWPELAEPSHEA